MICARLQSHQTANQRRPLGFGSLNQRFGEKLLFYLQTRFPHTQKHNETVPLSLKLRSFTIAKSLAIHQM